MNWGHLLSCILCIAIVYFIYCSCKSPFLDLGSHIWISSHWMRIRDEIPPFDVGKVESLRVPPDKTFQIKKPPKAQWSIGWKTDSWYVFPLVYQGDAVQGAESICPSTLTLLHQLRGVRTAGFALLPEGAMIPTHTDFSTITANMLLQGEGQLTVRGIQRTLEPGKIVFFDSTYRHSAANTGKGNRVVLYMDIVL